MTKARTYFTDEWLQEFNETFSYEEDTGHILYKRFYHGNTAGSRADSIKSLGNRNGKPRGKVAVINFKSIRVYSHRAAFFLKLGVIPDEDLDIDHDDRDKLNNKWSNIRIATKSENMFNAAIRCDNTSGMKGVSITPFNTYRASMQVDGKLIIRTFKTDIAAMSFLEDIRNKHHKEFARHV